MTSTKPYFVRALHEWCVDNGFTPHLLVKVIKGTQVPLAYVKNGEIVLNLSYTATKDLMIANDAITFSARFGGVSNDLYIPINAVRGIFARENGQGMMFPEEADASISENPSLEVEKNNIQEEKKQQIAKKPTLTLVK